MASLAAWLGFGAGRPAGSSAMVSAMRSMRARTCPSSLCSDGDRQLLSNTLCHALKHPALQSARAQICAAGQHMSFSCGLHSSTLPLRCSAGCSLKYWSGAAALGRFAIGVYEETGLAAAPSEWPQSWQGTRTLLMRGTVHAEQWGVLRRCSREAGCWPHPCGLCSLRRGCTQQAGSFHATGLEAGPEGGKSVWQRPDSSACSLDRLVRHAPTQPCTDGPTWMAAWVILAAATVAAVSASLPCTGLAEAD